LAKSRDKRKLTLKASTSPQDKKASKSKAGEDKAEPKLAQRSEDLSGKEKIRDKLQKIFKDVEKGFRSQWDRANDGMDWWDVYNCVLNAKQFYVGNAKIYVPIVKNAINARKTRYINQIFPVSGRYVDVITSDGTRPSATSSLLEDYVRKAELRTKVMPALCKNGDVEGQYTVYVSWCKRKRHVTWRTMERPEIQDEDGESLGVENPAADEVETMKEEEIEAAHPEVEVIPDSDLLVLPQTADTIPEALACGGSATILRRWSKEKLQELIDDGDIEKDVGEELIEAMEDTAGKGKDPPEFMNQKKENVDAAGIKDGDGGVKHALIYETWVMLKVEGERRICRAFYAGSRGESDYILGCRVNPFWSDRLPLLSVPVEKVAGVFKGRSKVVDVAPLQYAANDAINEAWDSAAYSLMPIVMTDPEKNPRTGSMILAQAAIWETDPKSTQILQFPNLWQHGFEMVNNCKAEVSQTLNVSPAAITQGVGAQLKQKQNQAQIAQEQMIDILTTGDAVTVLEEGILTPILTLFLELDHQFRDDEVTVKSYGEMGQRAKMEEIPPTQMEHRYTFKWLGVESARNAQQMQQQISFMNVLTQIPPGALNGRKVDIGPILEQTCENIYGPRISPLVLIKAIDMMPVPVVEENAMLAEGFEVPVHPQDDDDAHIQAHFAAMKQQGMLGGKNLKKYQAHIFMHMQQKQAKIMQQQQGPPQQGQQQGGPQQKQGGGGPKPGGAAQAPRGGQQPPGALGQDQMQKAGDATAFPRKQGFGGGVRM
jgi:hypothetical protein